MLPPVSNPLVRRIRFALLLPLLHLGILAAPMFREESRVWQYVPQAQSNEDWERKWEGEHPGTSEGMATPPCYEYRFSNADRLIFAIDTPVSSVLGVSGDGCPESLLRPTIEKLNYRLPVRSRVILAETLIVLGVWMQWWLIGRWLDRKRTQLRPIRLSIVPAAVITMCGIIMLPTTFFRGPSTAELVNIFSGMLALLAWLVLLVAIATVGTKWLASKFRREGASAGS